ncbi:DUF2145 domain-containing protein [uncultured Psychrosphaera sp.]|uniref:DUF2145 domain-containing protein n=1 Tax=uncultured Psychrosphaera sp. TaxID=1403522 RepID=UPI00260E8ACA|nr:DUF2145 domain-containing protein [uncultured Psychrosphaera sp.]
MNTKQLILVIFKLITLLLIFSAEPTWAGSNRSSDIQHEPLVVSEFAKNVEKYAASQGARAFIIGRVGQPEKDLPKGIAFTHTAIAVYSSIKLESGELLKGYAIYNLYQNDNNLDRSSLVTDYPVDFFWGVSSLKAGIIIPTESLQQRLIQAIAAGNGEAIHNPKYSVLANPFNTKYQNCTEHTLDLINSAIYETTDIKQLKVNSKAYFNPQKVKMNGLKLALGGLFMDGVHNSDHKGKPRTATFTSIAKYLQQFELMNKAVTLNAEGEVTPLLKS